MELDDQDAVEFIERHGLGFHLGSAVSLISAAARCTDSFEASNKVRAAIWHLQRFANGNGVDADRMDSRSLRKSASSRRNAGTLGDSVVQILVENSDAEISLRHLASTLGVTRNVLASAVTRLLRHGRVARVGRGLYRLPVRCSPKVQAQPSVRVSSEVNPLF